MKRIIILVSALSLQLSSFGQGPLTPPGPPAPTMKALDQIEPRTPIFAVPATISAAGSYYLATNVTCTACGGGTNGITITAADVTLDLMGFHLDGIAGSGHGVYVSIPRTGILIRNGLLSDWGGDCLNLSNAQTSAVEKIHMDAGPGVGVRIGFYSRVEECTLTVASPSPAGIVLSLSSMVKNCLVQLGSPGAIAIDVGRASRAEGCNVRGSTTGTIGIRATNFCYVVDNQLDGAGLTTGLLLTGNGARAEGNHFTGNGIGLRADSGPNLIIRNSGRGNTTNFLFNAAQNFGPTNNLFGTGSVITNENPWANFSF